MDPQLKQRLIGAAVLVVLAVIFVPMVLDGSATPESQTIDLAIPPAPGSATETRVVPLDPAAIPQPVPAPSSLSDAIATVDTAVAPRVDAVDAATTPGTATAAPNDPVAPASPETLPAAAAPVPAATAPAAPPVVAPAPASPGAVPAPVTGGRYAVSFGSYSRRENAQALVESLKQSRIPAYAESVDVNGQAGMRVRAGPYSDRTQAEQVRLIARQARPDVPGSIVEIDNTAAAPATAAAAGAVTGWSVQVGAYKAQADANAQRDKLRGGGFAAYVDVLRAEGSTLYRVRVGPEAQRANAEKLRDALRARFGLNGNVVTQS